MGFVCSDSPCFVLLTVAEIVWASAPVVGFAIVVAEASIVVVKACIVVVEATIVVVESVIVELLVVAITAAATVGDVAKVQQIFQSKESKNIMFSYLIAFEKYLSSNYDLPVIDIILPWRLSLPPPTASTGSPRGKEEALVTVHLLPPRPFPGLPKLCRLGPTKPSGTSWTSWASSREAGLPPPSSSATRILVQGSLQQIVTLVNRPGVAGDLLHTTLLVSKKN